MNYTPEWEPTEAFRPTSIDVLEDSENGRRAGFRREGDEIEVFEKPLLIRRGFSLFGWTFWFSRD